MKRFAYVCADPGIPVPGTKGASIHVESVVRALRDLGLEGDVFTVRPEDDEVAGAPLHKLRLPARRKRKSMEERESRLFLGSLNSVIAPGEPPDFIYERYSLWHAGGLARARELGIPFILEVNSPLPDEARRFRHLANEPLAAGLARLLLREADGVVCVSKEIADWVVEHRDHDGGVWVIPNGVDPDLFAPQRGQRPSPLPPDDVPLVAFCGSFRPWHGLDDLLTAFEILAGEASNAELVCIGDGPMRDGFEEKIRERGMSPRVHLTGQLAHQEVPRWLGGADVAVAPYPELEDFYFSPLKIFEFLSLGLPVVASDVGQIRELMAEGERGFVYPPGQPRVLADRISRLLEHREDARRMGDAGRSWVLEHASWRKRVEDILDRIGALH